MLRKNGHFLLRVIEIRGKDKKASRELCLSTFWNGRVHHFLLRPDASKRYQICPALPGEKLPKFENVLTMVKHYMQTKAEFSNLKIVLKKPIRRQVS